MAVTEEARHKLYQALEERLGHDEATILMDHLPYGGWINLATKDDLALLRRDLDELRTSTATEFESLRASMVTKTEQEGLRRDMEVMRSAIETDFADFRADLARKMLHYFVTLVTVSLTAAGLLAALIIRG